MSTHTEWEALQIANRTALRYRNNPSRDLLEQARETASVVGFPELWETKFLTPKPQERPVRKLTLVSINGQAKFLWLKHQPDGSVILPTEYLAKLWGIKRGEAIRFGR